jgi:hypothetical protein
MSLAERDRIIDAINQLGRRVTVGDIAAKTGLPLLAAGRALNGVAADCKATLQVGADGTLVYKFRPAFETAYIGSALHEGLKRCAKSVFDTGYYLLRMSFGVTLIASLVTVAVLIVIAVLALLSKFTDGDSGGGGGGGDWNLDWLADCSQFFRWDINYSPPNPVVDYSAQTAIDASEAAYQSFLKGHYTAPGTKPLRKKQGFVLNCFSYLFGDGNPNRDLEQRKWQALAAHIRANNGVATAEQLACYTGADPRKEDGALPVLVRFDGHPEVTDTGNIIYVFPSLQVSAAGAHTTVAPEKYLIEHEWKFSEYPGSEFVSVVIFALLNFAGSMWLLSHVSTIAALHPYRYLIDWLSGYAAFFIFFPLARAIVLAFVNAGIAIRNDRRRQIYLYTVSDGTKKAIEAKAFSIKLNTTSASADNVIYSTDRDALEQQFETQ